MWFLHPSACILLKLVGTKWYPGAKWSLQQPRPSVEHLYWMKMLLQRQQFWQYWQLQKLLKLTLKRMLGKVQKPLTKYFQADAQGTNGAKVLFSVVRCWTLVLWALSGKLTWIFYFFSFQMRSWRKSFTKPADEANHNRWFERFERTGISGYFPYSAFSLNPKLSI